MFENSHSTTAKSGTPGPTEDIFSDIDTRHSSATAAPKAPPSAGDFEHDTESATPLVIKRDVDVPSPFQPVGDKSAVDQPPIISAPQPIAPSALMMDSPAFSMRKLFMIIVAVVVIGGGAFGVWRFWGQRETPTTFPEKVQPASENEFVGETPALTDEEQVQVPETENVIPDTDTSLPVTIPDDSDMTPNETDQEAVQEKPGVFPDLPPDKDADGLPDIEESQYGTNPLSSDSDGDGLYDREEVKSWKTDPTNPDTDGDSFLDGEEVKLGYDPTGPGRLLTIPPEM